MDITLMKRAAGIVSTVAVSAAVIVACSHNAVKDTAASATSAASAAMSAGSSAVSAASTAASAVIAGSPTTVSVAGVGEVVMEPFIAEAYTKAGGEAKLGAPTAQAEKVGDGTVQAFAKGTIYSSPTTGAYLVQGEILKAYNEQGGAAGALGYPTANEKETAGGPTVAKGGWVGEFQKGTISWLNQGDGTFTETIVKK